MTSASCGGQYRNGETYRDVELNHVQVEMRKWLLVGTDERIYRPDLTATPVLEGNTISPAAVHPLDKNTRPLRMRKLGRRFEGDLVSTLDQVGLGRIGLEKNLSMVDIWRGEGLDGSLASGAGETRLAACEGDGTRVRGRRRDAHSTRRRAVRPRGMALRGRMMLWKALLVVRRRMAGRGAVERWRRPAGGTHGGSRRSGALVAFALRR